MSDLTETTLRSDSSQYNKGTLQAQIIHEELNTIMNYQNIVSRIKANTARDVAAEPKVNKNPAFIIGSGPSLDDSIEHLKDWEGGIFCSTSHALTLMRFGIEPTHIVALDPFCTWDELDGVDWSKTKTKLIAHPGIWPDLIEKWPNEILLFIESLGDPNTFYASTQKRMYTWREFHNGKDLRNCTFHYYIPTEITLFACSPPIQMFLADLLGYGTIFLAGLDFAYNHTKTRFTNYTKDENGEWVKHEHLMSAINADKKRADGEAGNPWVTTTNGKWSQKIHLYYKKNFITSWRLSHQTIYSTDDIDSLPELPHVNIKDVVESRGIGYATQSYELINDISEKYLATVSAFVIDSKNGVSFIEAPENTPQAITTMLYEVFSFYRCPKCGNSVQANDTVDHENEECPVCKQGQLTHANPIDIEANIVKFMRLIENAKGKVPPRSEWVVHPDRFPGIQQQAAQGANA